MSTELLELVHTLGRAVEDLTLLVSGVPAMVDGKLEAMQVAFTATVVQLRSQMDELQSEAGSVRGQLNSLSGALAVQLADHREELVAVIGDNRAAADKQVQEQLAAQVTTFDKRLVELNTTLDSAGVQFSQSVATLRTDVETVRSTLGEELAAQRGLINEVRQACDTTDLAHGIAKLEHRAAETEASVEQVSLGVTKLALQTDGRLEDQQATVQRLATQVGEIVPFDPTPINERFDSLEDQCHNTAHKADTTAAKVSEISLELTETTGRVELHASRLQVLTERVGEIKPFDLTPLLERTTRIEQGWLETTERFKAASEELVAVVESQEASLQVLTERVGEIKPFDPTPLTGSITAVEQRLLEVSDIMAAADEQFARTTEGFITNLQVLTARVNDIKPFDQQPLVESIATIEQSMLETADLIKSMEEGHALALRTTAHTIETHAGSLAELEERINGIKPFDPTELNDAIGEVRTVLAEDIATLRTVVSQHGEVATSTALEVKRHSDLLSSQGETITSNHAAIVQRVIEDKFNLGASIAGIVEDIGLLNNEISDVREDIAKTRTSVGEGFEKGIATLMQQTEELAQQVSAYRVSAEQITARLNGIEKTAEGFATRQQVEEARQQVEEDARKLAASLEQFGEGFAQTLANIESSLRSSFGEKLETLQDALDKRISELPAPPEPEPFDPSELRATLFTELSARLADMAPEIPEPQFDVQFNDQTLVVSLTVGDKVVTRSTTLGLGIEYLGVYKHDGDYKAGNLVTHKGSMWFAKSKPTGEPGKDIMGWQLAVKCGRDGKDATPTRAYTGHATGRVYRETDFLRINNRLWQCAVKETSVVPEPGDITSSAEWTLIGGIQ